MKKLYIKPITELVAINLQDSLLDNEVDWGQGSIGGTEWNSNNDFIDIEDEANDLPTSKSLWE